MDTNTTREVTPTGTSTQTVTASQVRHPSNVSIPNSAGKVTPQEPIQGPRPPSRNGLSIKELGLLIRPSPVGPVFLITKEATHEFSRVYYSDGKYSLSGAGDGRLGMSRLWDCELSKDGCVLTFSTGHKMEIPRSWYTYTWVPDDIIK